MNTLEVILQSIKMHAGTETWNKVRRTCDKSDIQSILVGLKKAAGEEGVSQVMRSCGRECINSRMISRAKDLYRVSATRKDFLRRMNDDRIGGGNLHIRHGKIVGGYDKCYCSRARALPGLTPLYCHCSAGWYERLFSEVLQKPVTVKIIHTILGGSPDCEFEIDCGD